MPRILIAEDDDTSALILRRILESAGHAVTRARTGMEAMGLLRDGDFDAVVTDWMMPELDGLELVRKIQARFHPRPALVMVTCLALPDARAHALESGADEFVNKPVRPREVLAALDRALARMKPVPLPLPPAAPLAVHAPRTPFPLVTVGANAGGPAALRILLRGCGPAAFGAAWIVAQNGQPEMLLGMIPALGRETRMRIVLATDGLALSPGRVVLAPGGSHVVVAEDGLSVRRVREPAVNHVRPSADVLFRSAASAAGSRCTAVILTGMGCDGTAGAAAVLAAGGHVLVARPSARVAAGMAESVVRAGLASAIEPLEALGAAITRGIASLVTGPALSSAV